MYHFRIAFEYPWLLLLIIPALGLTLFFYFRSAKKYRRNRNRITSIVLHMLVMTLCVCVLSGIVFLYDVPNTDNQIVLLVDMSDSNNESEDRRDTLVREILDESRSQYNVGIVLFGYDQVLAAPMTYDVEDAYRRYNSAALPDTTATDIASALHYAKTLFTNSGTGTSKIVLISDGLETDGDALTAVRSVAADGIRVDTMSVTRPETDEVEICSIVVPDYNVVVGDDFKMTVKLRSSVSGEATMTLFDNYEAELTGTVPAGKLSLLLTTAGSQWKNGKRVSNADSGEIAELLADEQNTESYYSSRYACAYLAQKMQGNTVTVWYLDRQAAEARRQMCAFFGVDQICLSDMDAMSADVLEGLR